jgi:hypothetical protein
LYALTSWRIDSHRAFVVATSTPQDEHRPLRTRAVTARSPYSASMSHVDDTRARLLSVIWSEIRAVNPEDVTNQPAAARAVASGAAPQDVTAAINTCSPDPRAPYTLWFGSDRLQQPLGGDAGIRLVDGIVWVMDLWQFYDRVEALIRNLRDAGCSEAASHVERALRAGATSGEILGDLKMALPSARAAAPEMSADIDDLEAFVSEALWPRPWRGTDYEA